MKHHPIRALKAFFSAFQILCEMPRVFEELREAVQELKEEVVALRDEPRSPPAAAEEAEAAREAENFAEEPVGDEKVPEKEWEKLREIKRHLGAGFDAHYALYQDYTSGAWNQQGVFNAIPAENYESFLVQCASPKNMTRIYHSLRDLLYTRALDDRYLAMADRLIDCCVQLCSWSGQEELRRQTVPPGADYDENRHDACNNGGNQVARILLPGVTDRRNDIYKDCRAYVTLE